METPRAKEAQRRIAADPWDTDGWNMLAAEARNASFLLAKPIYEKLVAQFPPTAKFWLAYCDAQARNSNLDLDASIADLIALYDRAVLNAPTSVELWQSYASCMFNILRRPQQTMVNETRVAQVYERGLSAAGLDVKADSLWFQYLIFIGTHSSLSDTQRRDDLRRIHQRAVMLFTNLFSLIRLPCTSIVHLGSLLVVPQMRRTARLIYLSHFIKKRTFIHLLVAPVFTLSVSCVLTEVPRTFPVVILCFCLLVAVLYLFYYCTSCACTLMLPRYGLVVVHSPYYSASCSPLFDFLQTYRYLPRECPCPSLSGGLY